MCVSLISEEAGLYIRDRVSDLVKLLKMSLLMQLKWDIGTVTVMVNFMYQLGELRDAQIADKTVFLDVSVRVFREAFNLAD